MVPARSTRHAPGRRAVRLLAAAIVLQLTAGLVTAAVLHRAEPPPAVAGTEQGRVAPPGHLAPAEAPPAPSPGLDRTRAVALLLEQRAAAVRSRDREAFLATVDPRAGELRARQAALFDALEQVPLSHWDYVLDPTEAQPPDRELDRRYGAGAWWAPGVTLRYALADFDPRPAVVDHHLTFVQRDGRWLLAADDDFALRGRATPRALWDRGPVVAVRAPGVLVLGHPRSDGLLQQAASLAAEAVPRVTAVWGPWTERVVVVVPTDARELAGLLGSDGDVSRLAAVATAQLGGGTDSHDPTGERVLLNPDAFGGLGELGRRVVLTHEVTHVATRRATGPAVPAWLAEGLADLVAFSELDVSTGAAARDLRRAVRAGRVPEALPADTDFDAANARLAEAYQASWFAVQLLADRYGMPALLDLYRTVGARRGVPADRALDDALQSELGTSTEALTATWREALQRQLG